MPLSLADITRETPPVPGSAPMPGMPPPALVGEPPGTPPAEAPAAPPVTAEGGLADLRAGADLIRGAAQRATERQQQIDAERAQMRQAEQERQAPLWAGLQEVTARPTPGVVEPFAMPAPPSREVRPFASGVEGEPPEQALQRAVMGLTQLALMGFGASAGVPEMSLRVLAGAMQGWQEGDLLRGDREFQEWQASVSAMQQDYTNRRQHLEDIVARNRGDLERLRTAIFLEMGQSELSRRDFEALTQGVDAFFRHDAEQGQAIMRVGQATAQVADNIEARKLQQQQIENLARHQRNQDVIAAAAAQQKADWGRVLTAALTGQSIPGTSQPGTGPAAPTSTVPGASGAPVAAAPPSGAPAPSLEVGGINVGPGGGSVQLRPTVSPEAKAKAREALVGLNQADAVVTTVEEMAKKLMTATDAMGAKEQGAQLYWDAYWQNNPVAAAYLGTQKSFVGSLSRTLLAERGVLTDQDIQRAANALPSFFDTAAVRDLKLGFLRNLLQTAREGEQALLAGQPLPQNYHARIQKLLSDVEEANKAPTAAKRRIIGPDNQEYNLGPGAALPEGYRYK